MDELMALPYLDAVARETLRLHAPVPMTVRVATKEDFIPLDIPFTDRKGQVHTTIRQVVRLLVNSFTNATLEMPELPTKMPYLFPYSP